MIERYDDIAVQNGVKLISCCAHDSIPWDISTFKIAQPLKQKDEELAKKGDWDLGSGDTIPPEITLDEKALEKLKKCGDKQISATNAKLQPIGYSHVIIF